MARPTVNFPLVVLVATVAGLVLGLSAIALLELTADDQPVAPADPVVDLLAVAPPGIAREMALDALRPGLVAALDEGTTARRQAAVTLLTRVGSGRLLIDVEESMGLAAMERARGRAADEPLAVGEEMVAQLERAWLPPGTRRAATELLWGLLESHARALMPKRALRWTEAALAHGGPDGARGDVALSVLTYVVETGLLPGPDGQPALGEALLRVRAALESRITAQQAALLARLQPLAEGEGPPELIGVRLRELAEDPATPEPWRPALLRAQAVVAANARLLLDGDAEGALAILDEAGEHGSESAEPAADEERSAEAAAHEGAAANEERSPGAAALRARVEARLGDTEAAVEVLEPWTRPGLTLAPELRRQAARLLRRRGRIAEAEALLPPDLKGRLYTIARARAEAWQAARSGNGQLADLQMADARALVDSLDWASEAMLLELARADLRPSRAAHHVGRALPIAEAARRAATADERTPVRLCAWALVLARAPEVAGEQGASAGSAGDEEGAGGDARGGTTESRATTASAAAALLDEAARAEGAAELDLAGRCALQLGMKGEARRILERAFDRATTLDLRARVAYRRFTAASSLEDAVTWARKAADLGAGDAAGPMLEAQAQLYARRGQLGDACQILDALLESATPDPRDAASLVEVASYHRSRFDCRGDLADLESAADILRRAAVLDDGPVVLANQADVLAHLGLVRLLDGEIDTRALALSSSRPEFLELLAMGGSRGAVLQAARRSPELVEAVALHELLARRSAADDAALDWLVRWYELHDARQDLERLARELPAGQLAVVEACTSDPGCVAILRDGWQRARRIVKRAALASPRTRAAAAVFLAAAARDLAPVSADGEQPLAVAEAALRSALGRERWSEVAVALAHVLVAQVAAEQRETAELVPSLWPLLAEVEQLRAIGAPSDPRLTEAAELVRWAVTAGARPGRLEARIVGLVAETEGADLLARWASRPGVLEARTIAATLTPGDPAAILGLAGALEGLGETDVARAVLDASRKQGLPVPAALDP